MVNDGETLSGKGDEAKSPEEEELMKLLLKQEEQKIRRKDKPSPNLPSLQSRAYLENRLRQFTKIIEDDSCSAEDSFDLEERRKKQGSPVGFLALLSEQERGGQPPSRIAIPNPVEGSEGAFCSLFGYSKITGLKCTSLNESECILCGGVW